MPLLSSTAPRRAGLVGAALLAIALLALALTPGARAATRADTTPGQVRGVTPVTPLARGDGYVALGDSVTFGYQEPQVTPAPNYPDAASFPGYPEQIATALHVKIANFSCPGETSASLIDASAPSNGCENAYRKSFPLHVRYAGAQLTAALSYLRAHTGVRLVSLMIGANDLFRCQGQTSDGCAFELPAALRAISAHVRHTLSAIRTGGYRGQIVILNYYSLNYSAPAVSAFSEQLNAAQDSAARPFDVRIADGYGELRSASARFGANPCLAGLLTQLGSYGSCGVHPSSGGQTLLAKAVIATTRLP